MFISLVFPGLYWRLGFYLRNIDLYVLTLFVYLNFLFVIILLQKNKVKCCQWQIVFTHDALLSLQKLELQISELKAIRVVGSVVFDTDRLKLALTQECRLWKRAFGAALNRRASADMDAVFSFVDGLTKRLQRPITDLEDVRGAMAALREVSQRLIG